MLSPVGLSGYASEAENVLGRKETFNSPCTESRNHRRSVRVHKSLWLYMKALNFFDCLEIFFKF